MAVKKLSSDIQSLFSSSIHLFSYKRAVEELVYNALDAESTSIAIRVHIQENKIQVVDNGNGIAKEDFNMLGQRYATSKFVDLSILKAVPNTYGFRGQALASIADVSKRITITSRIHNTNETWTKTFFKGRSEEPSETTMRPSKGTTVGINEFLYNLKIQSKAVDYINELNNIKILLQQLSLVHTNVSFTLRDDSRNEIIFKVHKNRDIYQTFKSLHDIEKAEVQELQVEKSQYKAVAYIGKQLDHMNRHQWIFINKKAICNPYLHKLIQGQLKKRFQDTSRKSNKYKNTNTDDFDVGKNCIPFYYIFITCPHGDYEISNTPKQSFLEFKNWDEITTLVQKVVKFYTGDLKLREIQSRNNEEINEVQENDTREQVKEIMKKILGNFPKNPGVSQMHNGIKGKRIKRMNKKISLSKILLTKSKQCGNSKGTIKTNNKLKNLEIKEISKETLNPRLRLNFIKPKVTPHHHSKSKNIKMMSFKENHDIPKISNMNIKNVKKHKIKKDPLIKAFENKKGSITKRCDMLAKKVDTFIPLRNTKNMRRVFINETINYSNLEKKNENVTVRKHVEETIIHKYIPLKPADLNYKKDINKNYDKKHFKTSHDLVKTIIQGENNRKHSQITINNVKPMKFYEQSNRKFPQLTFQSHHYANTNNQSNFIVANHNDPQKFSYCQPRQKHFATERSIETFTLSIEQPPPKNSSTYNLLTKKQKDLKCPKTNMINKLGKNITECKKAMPFNFNNFSNDISSYTIDTYYSKKDNNNLYFENNYTVLNNEKSFENADLNELSKNNTVKSNIALTYTLTKSNYMTEFKSDLRLNDSYILHTGKDWTEQCITRYITSEDVTLNRMGYMIQDNNDSLNVLHISTSCPSIIEDTSYDNMEPLNICEAILESDDVTGALVTNKKINLNDSLYNFNTSELCGDIREVPENNTRNVISITTNQTLEHEMCNLDYELQEVEESISKNKLNDNTQNSNADNVAFENIPEQDQRENDCFSIRNRLRFLPKGMSPIFKNTYNIKNKGDFQFERDYFEEVMYNKFMDNIQQQTDIYEADVHKPNDVTTKAIDKVYSRLNKENSSLTFNTQSLEEARVLGQVDSKFIATIMKGKTDTSEFIVLFDQHAVHERIRLENNLADYYDGSSWKSIKLDDIILKLSKDEILYLHNYKDKFKPFGMNWTVLNNHEILLHAIPEAILGKNPRQVDKVMNAVKNLISEEISIIKSQKGCTSIYPKSIMDLIFSEACRYAIMFGDRLSKIDCVELIQKLSVCKTPFQCAHGRPVMAVIMQVTSERRHYQINMDKVKLHDLKTTKK